MNNTQGNDNGPGPVWRPLTPFAWTHVGFRQDGIAVTIRRRHPRECTLPWAWSVHDGREGREGFHATGYATSPLRAATAAVAAGSLARALLSEHSLEAELLERIRSLEGEIALYEKQASVLRNTVASARLSDVGDTAILDVVVESLRDGPHG